MNLNIAQGNDIKKIFLRRTHFKLSHCQILEKDVTFSRTSRIIFRCWCLNSVETAILIKIPVSCLIWKTKPELRGLLQKSFDVLNGSHMNQES